MCEKQASSNSILIRLYFNQNLQNDSNRSETTARALNIFILYGILLSDAGKQSVKSSFKNKIQSPTFPFISHSLS